MIDRHQFAQKISTLDLSRADQAIALLWFYRATQTYDERSASDLATDLGDEGLGRPNVTLLKKSLTKSKKTVKGKRPSTFQIHTKYLAELDKEYNPLLNIKKKVIATSAIIPTNLVQGTRVYLERLVEELNGSYDCGWYDSCAVMIRRLMESLIIEVFIYQNRANEIKNNNVFVSLDKLIAKITNDSKIHLGRNTPKAMNNIKKLGDTAAHDRTYITGIQDIDDLKSDIRRTIQELFTLANIVKKKSK